MASVLPADPRQHSFEELAEPLQDVTFVVVDLETTGGSAARDAITEIGAVKVRGGEVLGEFATLVDPGRPIPPQIVMLTGITDAMVRSAPRIESVLPAFLEFARGCVLVAHNAGFDIGFLKAGCGRLDLAWPNPVVLDTVRLARSVLTRAEAPSVRLGVLAPLLGARVTPDHRALHDARATVDVLHALFERVGSLGVATLSELRSAARDVDPARRRKRRLADPLPSAPGVYLFRGRGEEVLYVGTSRDLRSRVLSYFTGAEVRTRVKHMVLQAERVDHVVCATALEARVRELRLIAAHRPRYNRRSRTPEKVYWVCLTEEAFPRLSIVRGPSPRLRACIGPYPSMHPARLALDALESAVPIRRCRQRLRREPAGSPCALHELGRCGAPCSGAESPEDYAAHVLAIRAVIDGRSDDVLRALRDRLQAQSESGRYADAAQLRDQLAALVDGLMRRQRLGALAAIAELVAAHPDGSGGWEMTVVRYGRLTAAGRARRGSDPMMVADALTASAETVFPRPGPLPGACPEETAAVLAWLDRPGTRLVRASAGWSVPAVGAGRWEHFTAAAAWARGEHQRAAAG